MRDKIIAKMTEHVELILSKSLISPEDFANLQSFLAFLDFYESKKKMEEDAKKNDERLKAMGLILGGGFNGV